MSVTFTGHVNIPFLQGEHDIVGAGDGDSDGGGLAL